MLGLLAVQLLLLLLLLCPSARLASVLWLKLVAQIQPARCMGVRVRARARRPPVRTAGPSPAPAYRLAVSVP